MTSNATPSWVIPVVPLGAVSAGVVAWRRGGQLHISPIVKVTFAFAPGGTMTPAPPLPVRVAEQSNDPKDPESSIREAADTAPELLRAEVLFAGSAYAPAGVPAAHVTVRVAVLAPKMDKEGNTTDKEGKPLPGPGEVILDKRLEVLGDRLLIPGHPPPEPEPFTQIPLTYERTYGGPDHKPNPVGLGMMAALGGRRRLPNIAHQARSDRPGVEPAGLAPLSYQWPARRRMLRTTPRSVLEQQVVDIPDDLDPLYFQSSPADQRLPDPRLPRTRPRFFRGDEWIVLEGLHKQHASLQMQLPGAKGVAHVYLPDGSHRPVTLVADTLFIDADNDRCTLTWRGAYKMPSIADLPSTGVVASVEWPGRPVVWPLHFPRVAPRRPDVDGYPEISVSEESLPEPYRAPRGAPPPLPGRVGPPPIPIAAPTFGAPAPTFGAPPPTFGAPPPQPQPTRRQGTMMLELDAPPPPPTAAPAPAAAPKTTALPVAGAAAAPDVDMEWGLGTMVLAEAEEPPAPQPAARGRQRTTVMGVGDMPAGFPATHLGAPPAPPPPQARPQVAIPAPPAPAAPRPPLKKP